EALARIMECISTINRYLEQTAPWTVVKSGNLERVGTILYTAAEALRVNSVLLSPVMPQKMENLWLWLGWQPPDDLSTSLVWGQLEPGTEVHKGATLFHRDLDR
ncbi:MAG: methionine--tRNA ligase, partial [Anaerolineae bacterium]|nr:methionine--tRNA ligase [Anaerolineae bacterium]